MGIIPVFEVDGLCFDYDNQIIALDHVAIIVKPGERLAILGSNGSGKSTLLKVLCGLYEITAGDYMINKYSVRELARGQLKNKLSVTLPPDRGFNLKRGQAMTIIFGIQQVHGAHYSTIANNW